VLVRSTLAERLPVHDLTTIRAMLTNADVIFTARLDGLRVGVSRAITDLSDLAVDERHQRQGVGRELIRRTHEAAGLHTTLILLAAPRRTIRTSGWRGTSRAGSSLGSQETSEDRRGRGEAGRARTSTGPWAITTAC
jgi:GNAT superfamily N-acetyltransferase